MMHAENGMAIDVVAADEVAAGHDRPVLPRRRPLPDLRGRGDEPGDPPGRGGRRARLHRPPVGARGPRTRSAHARDRGALAFAETCPQYLFLSLDDMGNGFEGAKFVCSPPLRPADHQAELWTGLVKDDLQLVVDRPLPVRLPRPEGARPGRLPEDPERAARASRTGSTCSTTAASSAAGSRASAGSRSSRRRPARMFGMYPRKGVDRGRLGRRPRRLRPEREAHDQRRDPPHGRRLLVLRGPDGPGRGRHRPVARLGHRPRRRVHRAGGPRPVRQARAGRLRPPGLRSALPPFGARHRTRAAISSPGGCKCGDCGAFRHRSPGRRHG